MHTITEGIGLKHHLWRTAEEGGRCHYFPEGGLSLAMFMREPSAAELRPKKVQLGLVVHKRAIIFVLKSDSNFYDMPYFHVEEIPELVGPGLGMACSLATCEASTGICESLAVRTMTNKFTNAFISAVKEQSGLTQEEFSAAVESAYQNWTDSKKLFGAASVIEEGWAQ
jgi:hypothetical protein